jgi:hypothetical protein
VDYRSMGVWDGMGFTALQRRVIKIFFDFLLHIGICTANKEGRMGGYQQSAWMDVWLYIRS